MRVFLPTVPTSCAFARRLCLSVVCRLPVCAWLISGFFFAVDVFVFQSIRVNLFRAIAEYCGGLSSQQHTFVSFTRIGHILHGGRRKSPADAVATARIP